jgi:hypothetical protein
VRVSSYLTIVTRKSKKDDRKAERVGAIFERFAVVAGKDIDPATIKSGVPGEPDIICATFSSEVLAFELCELCDQGLMAQSGRASKVLGIPSFSSLNCEDIRATFLKKLGKNYKGASKVDLLFYTDGRLIAPDEVAIDQLHVVLDNQVAVQFRSVWFLGERGTRQVE